MLSEMTDIYCLKEIISKNSIDEFLDIVKKEYEKKWEDLYENFERIQFKKWEKRGGIVKFLYKHWSYSRFLLRFYHKCRGVNNPKQFYSKQPFWERFEALRYPIINGNKEEGPFVQLVRDIYENIEEYIDIYETFDEEDELSRDVLFGLLKTRLTSDIRWLVKYSNEGEMQYFDSRIVESQKKFEKIVFCDVGAYIGDTLQELIKHVPNINSIYLYEPDSYNLEMAKRMARQLELGDIKINIRKKGLSNIKKQAYFEENGASGRVVNSIEQFDKLGLIELTTLDDDVHEKVSFLKMDIEGEERNALRGARSHIVNDRPAVAVCVYHKEDDLRIIYSFLKECNADYKMFLRHYDYQYVGETVLYAV